MTALPAERAGLRKAVKFAGVGVDFTRGEGLLLPLTLGTPYPSEARAVCTRRDHPAPDERCTCGFHAARNVPELLELLRPCLTSLARRALLDVELGGLELAGPRGLRAAEQRVLGVRLFPWCTFCDVDPPPAAGPPRLCVRPYSRERLHRVEPLCDAHATRRAWYEPLSLADVSGLLCTEVTWATAALSKQIVTYGERMAALGPLSRPRLGQPHVASMLTGQLAFVDPAAVRLADGRLDVDADAVVVRRPDERRWLPLARGADRSFELVVIPDSATAIETALLTPSPIEPAPRRLLPVTRVNGLRHCPRLAAALGK